MIRRSWPLGLVLLGLWACAYEKSFKSMTLAGVERESVFDACQRVIVDEYQGVHIRVDRESGRIETDPVDFSVEDGARREQAYLLLQDRGDGVFEVEVMAPLSEMVIDPSEDPPVRWRVKGSDVKQERRILDRILSEVLLRHPEAQVLDER